MGEAVAWAPGAHDLQDLELRLALDGDVRQEGRTADMTWDVASLIAAATTWTTLKAGDWLLTGTPEGVGPIRPGQVMRAEVVGHARVENLIVGK